MSDHSRAGILKAYLERISGDGGLENLAEATEAPMPMGGSSAAPPPDTEVDIARAAVKKLAMGQSIDRNEAMLIEAIIVPDKRPAIDIIGGAFTVQQRMWKHYADDAVIRQNILSTIPAVGRIEVPDHRTLPYRSALGR